MTSSSTSGYVSRASQKLIFYNQYKNGKPFDNSENGMAKAVSQALEGQLKSKHSQNIAQRIAAVSTFSPRKVSGG